MTEACYSHTQDAHPMYMRHSLSGSCASCSSCCTWPSTLRASPSPAARAAFTAHHWTIALVKATLPGCHPQIKHKAPQTSF